MQVRSLGQEDALEEEMTTHSSILAWRIPWTGRFRSVESQSWTQLGDWSCARFLRAFLPGSMLLLTSWLQSPSIVVLEPKKVKFVTASTFPLFVCRKVMGPDAMILVCF